MGKGWGRVPYTPGKLRAVGIKNGQPVASAEIATTGSPAKIKLSPDRSTLKAIPGDLSYITVEVTDSAGHTHPQALNPIYFTVHGVGSIAAVGNSDPTSKESYVGNQRSAYRGRCLVVVKTSGDAGEIHLLAMADGLEGTEVVLQVR